MDSPNEAPAKSILKSSHNSGSGYNLHMKRASFKDDPILIQFSEQMANQAAEMAEAEARDHSLPPTVCEEQNFPSSSSSSSTHVFGRRKSFEERRKEFYGEDNINVRSLLASPPKELFLAEDEAAAMTTSTDAVADSGCMLDDDEQSAAALGCRMEKMEVSSDCTAGEAAAAPPPSGDSGSSSHCLNRRAHFS